MDVMDAKAKLYRKRQKYDSIPGLFPIRINIYPDLHGTMSSAFSFRKCESRRFTLKRQTQLNRIFKPWDGEEAAGTCPNLFTRVVAPFRPGLNVFLR